MSELRQDTTTGRWVIIAPKRALRPGEQTIANAVGKEPAAKPAFDPVCPFCPGNESQLPDIVSEYRTDRPPHWNVRAVPNKFPAVTAGAEPGPRREREARDGYGFHEVIIESARHDADLVTMSDAEIETVIAAYRDRSDELLSRPGIEAVVLFRNHGPRGGASLPHPHAQAVAIGLVPPVPALLASWGERYYASHGRCPTCDELAAETTRKVRIVEETARFVVLVPFAAERPCEIWVVPRRHCASFVDLDEAERSELARLLRRSLLRLLRSRNDPAYNFVIDSAARKDRGSPFVHWRLRIVPELATWGGFELGAGLAINPSSPEDDAGILRMTPTDSEACHEGRHIRG